MKRTFFLALLAAATFATAAEQKAPAQPSPDPFMALTLHKTGDSRINIVTLEAYIRSSAPGSYREIESHLLIALQSRGATLDGKRAILRLLGTVASRESVPALAAFLGDAQLSHPARLALERISDRSAAAALRDALPKSKGKLLIGIIGSVGFKRDAQAVGALAMLAANSDDAVATAALVALGEIGNADAAKALADARVPDALARTVARARIECAARMAAAGDAKSALAVYESLFDSKVPFIRAGAIVGRAATQPAKSVALMTEALQSDCKLCRSAAARALFVSPDRKLKTAVAGKLPTLNTTGQLALLGVLVDRPEVPARGVLLKALESSDDAIRIAALQALVTHGETADVPALLKLAVQTGPVADAAKKTLEEMHKRGTGAAMLEALKTAVGDERRVLLGVVATRHVAGSMETLLTFAHHPDIAVAKEAVRAIGVMGGAAEVSALADVIITTKDGGLRDSAVGAAGTICTRVSDPETCAKSLAAALGRADTADAKVAVLRVLPRAKSAAALDAARAAVKDKNAAVVEGAVRALADWPDLSAAPALMDIAKTAKDQKLAILALRGCARLVGINELPADARLKLAADVLATAKRPDEKRQALSAAGRIYTTPALEFLLKHAKDDAIALDAANAACRLAQDIEIRADQRKRIAAAIEEFKTLPNASDNFRKLVDETVKEVKSPTRRKRR